MNKKEFIIEVNSADDGDILIWKPPKDLFPPIPVKKELVRCKDCVYWKEKNEYRDHSICYYHSNEMNKFDFCSRAERKD